MKETVKDKHYRLIIILDYLFDDGVFEHGGTTDDKKFITLEELIGYLKSKYNAEMLDNLNTDGEYLSYSCEGIPEPEDDVGQKYFEQYTIIIEHVDSNITTENLSQNVIVLDKLGGV